MFEEDPGDVQRALLAALQGPQEVVVVELVDLLDVAEHDVAFPAQRLRHVLPHQLRQVVLYDELQGPHVIALRLDHLAHDQRQVPANTGKGL